MAGHWTDLYSFVTGAIRTPALGYLVLSNDEAAGRKVPLAGFVQWKPGGWADGGQVNWRVAGAAISRSPLEQLCAVGEFGGVLLLGSGDRHEEAIGAAKDSPKERGPLRGARAIGDHVYAVGMNRQVYRREAVNQWSSFDMGARPKTPADAVVGFEAVDGFSEQEMYAVGWDGEIWRCDGKQWTACASPTNSVLVDVCCAGNGVVYACGRNGLIVSGRHDVWKVMDVSPFSEDTWSVAWFNGDVYFATMDALFVLDGDALRVVAFGKDAPKSCYDLVAGPGVMWSIGAKDVMAFDGTRWSRID